MQSAYEAGFVREMGCTEAQWLDWLPRAIGEHDWVLRAQGANVRIGHGTLALSWRSLSPRQIALVSIPRLSVSFHFTDLSEAQRFAFMKRFDLFMQRGGG